MLKLTAADELVALENMNAAAERVRGRTGGGPAGRTATEVRGAAHEQEYQVRTFRVRLVPPVTA